MWMFNPPPTLYFISSFFDKTHRTAIGLISSGLWNTWLNNISERPVKNFNFTVILMTLTEWGKNQWMPVFIYFFYPHNPYRSPPSPPTSSNSLLDKGLLSLIISLTERKDGHKSRRTLFICSLIIWSIYQPSWAPKLHRQRVMANCILRSFILAQCNACWLV